MSDTLNDIKRMSGYSDELIEILRNAISGRLDGIPNGDLQSVAEAFTRKVYRAGKEQNG